MLLTQYGGWIIAAAGVFGLLIGSFLNVVVWRVPRGKSLLPNSRCPNCDTAITPLQNIPVISWVALRGKCAHCSASISARYPLVELATAASFALVTWWLLSFAPFAPGFATNSIAEATEAATAAEIMTLTASTPQFVAWWITLAAFLWFAGMSVSLVLIDLEHQLLPNAIVLPGLAVVGVLLTAAALITADWGRLISALGGGASFFVLYLLIALVYPSGLGGGDVKLAPVIGLVLGSVSWGAVVVGLFSGFFFAAVLGLLLIAIRKATRKTGIAFGPWIIAGAWVGAVWGDTISAAYLQVVGLE